MKEFQATKFVAWKAKLYEIVGFEPEIEVKWDTINLEESNLGRDTTFEYFEEVWFTPLLRVFEQICSDDMGKEAVRDGLKKIVIDGSKGTSWSESSFKDGELHILHLFDTNTKDDRVTGWTQMIEARL